MAISLPTLPTTSSGVPKIFLRTGCEYTNENPVGEALLGSQISFFADADTLLELPTSQYFLASVFRGVPVLLDGNYFVNDHI